MSDSDRGAFSPPPRSGLASPRDEQRDEQRDERPGREDQDAKGSDAKPPLPPRPKAWGSALWARVKRIELTDGLIVILTGVIAFSTWSSDQTFQRQLVEMKSSSDQTDRAIETSITNGATVAYQAALTARALGFAEISSKTAREELQTSRDTANRQLRAYVYAHPTVIEDFAIGKSPRWGVTDNMIGQTPAYDVRNSQLVAIGPYPQIPDITSKYTPISVGGTTSVLFPGDPLSSTTTLSCGGLNGKQVRDCVLTKEVFKLMNDTDAKIRIYLIGVISYNDAFGKPHTTPFCYTQVPNSRVGEVCVKYYKRPN